MDYASTVWHNPLKDKTHLRLKQRAQITIARLSTLPQDHLIHEVMARAKKRSTHMKLSPRFPVAETMRTLDLTYLEVLETISPAPLAPWRTPTFAEIEIEPDREKEKEQASALQATSNIMVYSDASGQRNQLGAAAVAFDQNQETIESRQICIGLMEYWTVHVAELIAIFFAISLVYKIAHQSPVASMPDPRPATILSDSTSALRAIRNPGINQISGLFTQSAEELKTRGVPLRLQWIPGHCDNPGNDAADWLAKEVVGPKGTHPFCRPVPSEKRLIQDQIPKQWEQEWKTSEKGRHLHWIDPTLPSVRSQRMYIQLITAELGLVAVACISPKVRVSG